MCVHAYARHRTTERQTDRTRNDKSKLYKRFWQFRFGLGRSDGSRTRVKRAKRYLLMLEWGVDERSCAKEELGMGVGFKFI